MMITNELLRIKYETQKRLDQEAQHSLQKYIENSRKTVQKAVAKYGLKLKYATPVISEPRAEETKVA